MADPLSAKRVSISPRKTTKVRDLQVLLEPSDGLEPSTPSLPWRGSLKPPPGCPRQESNLRTRFRKPLLYPLSYGGAADHDSVASVGLIRRDHPDADRGRRPARAGTRQVVPPRRHGRRRAISFAASTIPGFR